MSVRVGDKGGKSCRSGFGKGVSLMSVRVRKGGKSYVCQGSERGFKVLGLSGFGKGVSHMSVRVRKGGKSYVCQGSERG